MDIFINKYIKSLIWGIKYTHQMSIKIVLLFLYWIFGGVIPIPEIKVPIKIIVAMDNYFDINSNN